MIRTTMRRTTLKHGRSRVEGQTPMVTGLTDAQRAIIFEEIDALTVAKATEAIKKVVDVRLLETLDNYARLKGTRQAADSRLASLRGE